MSSAIKYHPTTAFFILAFVFTWAHWVPQALASRDLLTVQVPGFVTLIAGYGPALAAIIVTISVNGWPGLRQLGGRLLHWRVGLRWYALALLMPPLVMVAGLSLHLLTGGVPPSYTVAAGLPVGPGGSLWLQGALLFLIFTLGFDGLGEELGWRGLALPHLQARYSALVASLILGLFWGVWHIPYALTEGSALSNRSLLWLLVDILAAAILFTWLYNHTGGSVLLAILYHASRNTTHTMFPAVWRLLSPEQSRPGVTSSEVTDARIFLFEMGVRWLLAIAVLIVASRELGRGPRARSTLVAKVSS